MHRHRLLLLLLFALNAPVRAAERALVFIAPANLDMPLVRFEQSAVVGGILKDLGDAIARNVGRQARFLKVPSKRVGLVLAGGEADIVCYVLPNWIDGDFYWTQPVIPSAEVLVAHPQAGRVHALGELAGLRVGTVAGYRYPDLDAALGKRFVRDDATSMPNNFVKFGAGRSQYAIVDELMLAYKLRNETTLKLRVELRFNVFTTRCALSRASDLPTQRIEHAIEALVGEGGIDQILARYR